MDGFLGMLAGTWLCAPRESGENQSYEYLIALTRLVRGGVRSVSRVMFNREALRSHSKCAHSSRHKSRKDVFRLEILLLNMLDTTI